MMSTEDNGNMAQDTDESPRGLSTTKTPMFAATHAARYHRQELIRQIDACTHHHLICYVTGNDCSIQLDDTLGFVDLLHNIPRGDSIDLLLHTLGGDIDAAEKLI